MSRQSNAASVVSVRRRPAIRRHVLQRSLTLRHASPAPAALLRSTRPVVSISICHARMMSARRAAHYPDRANVPQTSRIRRAQTAPASPVPMRMPETERACYGRTAPRCAGGTTDHRCRTSARRIHGPWVDNLSSGAGNQLLRGYHQRRPSIRLGSLVVRLARMSASFSASAASLSSRTTAILHAHGRHASSSDRAATLDPPYQSDATWKRPIGPCAPQVMGHRLSELDTRTAVRECNRQKLPSIAA